jgi:hypothetical protein
MRGLAVAVLACACMISTRASAADQPEADRLFSEGRDLLEKGRFAEACEKLRRSEELSPAVGTLINLGYCYEQIARYRSAMDAYAEAELLAKDVNDDKREKFAHERFVAVEPKSLKLVIRVADAPSTGIVVKRNGLVVPEAEWGKQVYVDPEDWVISAEAPGRRPWRGAVVGRGEGAVVTVIVPLLEEATTEPTRGGGPGGGGSLGSLGTKRIAAVGLGGAALVSIGAGAALGVGAKSRYDDSLHHCDDTGCDEGGLEVQRSAVAQGNVATMLIALGLVCIGGGAYLWFAGADDAAKAAASRRLIVRPTAGGIGARFW